MVTPDLATYSSDAFFRFKVSWVRCFPPSAAAAATVFFFCVGDIVRFPAVLVVGGGVGGGGSGEDGDGGDGVGGVDVGGVGGEWHLSLVLLVLLVGFGVDVFVCMHACLRACRSPFTRLAFSSILAILRLPPRTSTSSRIFPSL